MRKRIAMFAGMAASIGLTAVLAVGLTAAASESANAGTINDSDLVFAPGTFYNGTGNDNQHFSVTTSNGVEVAQGAIIRYTGPDVTPTGNVYNVPLGETAASGHSGSAWGFRFSVNTGSTGLKLGDIFPTLTLHDVAKGTTGVLDLYLIADSAGYDGSTTNVAVNNLSTDIGFQNAETLSFAGIALGTRRLGLR